jgi:hypothetical protein
MSTLMKRKQKNNEVKHSIRMINQLDTENDIQINDNLETFNNNKQNFIEGAAQLNQYKSSNEELIKVIKAENKSRMGFQNSYDNSLNSPNFNQNKQNLSNFPQSISQSQGFFSKYNNNNNKINSGNVYNYQSFLYNLSMRVDGLSENLTKDFEDIEDLIENRMEDFRQKQK